MNSETTFPNKREFDKDIFIKLLQRRKLWMKEEFEKFYKEYFRNIFIYVYRKLLDEEVAQDITQEAFYVAYRNWKEVREHPEQLGWLVVVARNKIREYLRKMQYREAIDLDDVILEMGVKDLHYDIVEVELIAKENLRCEEWNLLKSYYWEEQEIEELARQAGVTINCMRVRITRVLQKLRDILEV